MNNPDNEGFALPNELSTEDYTNPVLTETPTSITRVPTVSVNATAPVRLEEIDTGETDTSVTLTGDFGIYRNSNPSLISPEMGRYPGLYNFKSSLNVVDSPMTRFAFSQTAVLAANASNIEANRTQALNSMVSQALRKREAEQTGILERLWKGQRETGFAKPQDRPFNPLQLEFGERGGGVTGALGYLLGTLGGVPKVLFAENFRQLNPNDPNAALQAYRSQVNTLAFNRPWLGVDKFLQKGDANANRYGRWQTLMGVLGASWLGGGINNPFQDNRLNNKVVQRGAGANLSALFGGRQFDDTDNRFSEEALIYDATRRNIRQGDKVTTQNPFTEKGRAYWGDWGRIVGGKLWDNFTNPGEFLTDALVIDRILKPVVKGGYKATVGTARRMRGVSKVSEETLSSLPDAAKALDNPYEGIDPDTGKLYTASNRLALPPASAKQIEVRNNQIAKQARERANQQAATLKKNEALLNRDEAKRQAMRVAQQERVATKVAGQQAVDPVGLPLPKKQLIELNSVVRNSPEVTEFLEGYKARTGRRPSAGQVSKFVETQNAARVSYGIIDVAKSFFDYHQLNDSVAKLVDEAGEVMPLNTGKSWVPEAEVITVRTVGKAANEVEIKVPVMRNGKPTKRMKVVATLTQPEYREYLARNPEPPRQPWQVPLLPQQPPINLRPNRPPTESLGTQLLTQGDLPNYLIRNPIPATPRLNLEPTAIGAKPQALLPEYVSKGGQLVPIEKVGLDELPEPQVVIKAAEQLGFTPEVFAKLTPQQQKMLPAYVKQGGDLVSTSSKQTPLETIPTAPTSRQTVSEELGGQVTQPTPQALLNSTGELLVRNDGSVELATSSAGSLVLRPDGSITARMTNDLNAPRVIMDASLLSELPDELILVPGRVARELEASDAQRLITGSDPQKMLEGSSALATRESEAIVETPVRMDATLEPLPKPDTESVKVLTGVVGENMMNVNSVAFKEDILSRVVVNSEVSYSILDNGIPKLLPPSAPIGKVNLLNESYRQMEATLRKNFYLLSNQPKLLNNARAMIAKVIEGVEVDPDVVRKGIQEALDDSLTRNLWDDVTQEANQVKASATNRYYRVIHDDFLTKETMLLPGSVEGTAKLALPASALSDLEIQLDNLTRALQLPVGTYLKPNKLSLDVVDSTGQALIRVIDGKVAPVIAEDLTAAQIKALPPATPEVIEQALRDATMEPAVAKIDPTSNLADNFNMDILVPEVEKLIPSKQLLTGTTSGKIPGDPLKRSIDAVAPNMALRSDGSLVVGVSTLADDVIDVLPTTQIAVGIPTKLGFLTLPELRAFPSRFLASIVDDIDEALSEILVGLQRIGDKNYYDVLPVKSSVDYNAVDKALDIAVDEIPEAIKPKVKVVKQGQLIGMHGTAVEEWLPIRNPYTESIGDLGFGSYLTDNLDVARTYARRIADETISQEVELTQFANVHQVIAKVPVNLVDASTTIPSAGIVKWFNYLGLPIDNLPPKFTTGKPHSIKQWYKELLSMGLKANVDEGLLRQYINGFDEFLARNNIDAIRSKELGFTKVLNTDKFTSSLVESTMDAVDNPNALFNNLVSYYATQAPTAHMNPIAFSRAINAKLDVLRNAYQALTDVKTRGSNHLFGKALSNTDDVFGDVIKADADLITKETNELVDEVRGLDDMVDLSNPCDF